MPQVSVIVPSYNHGKYLAETIESVLAQTWADFELVIVDDASKDDSQEILRHYQGCDPRVRPFFHHENLGASQAVNHGLDLAEGAYFTFCGSDDLFMEDKLERQLEVVREHPGRAIIADGYNIDQEGRKLGPLFSQAPALAAMRKHGDIFEFLLSNGGLYFFAQTLMVGRQLLEGIRFDESLVYYNEYKFVLELAQRSQFIYMDTPVFKHRELPGSLTEKMCLNNNERICEQADVIRYFMDQPGFKVSPTTYEYLYGYLIVGAIMRKDIPEVRCGLLALLAINTNLAQMVHAALSQGIEVLKIPMYYGEGIEINFDAIGVGVGDIPM